MNLTRFLVGRPLLTAMTFSGIALIGAAAAYQLPVSTMPDVDYPTVIVQVESPGTSATTVKAEVTDKIEKAISQLGSVKQLTGVSSVGASAVTVELTGGTDVNSAAADISQAVNKAAGSFPPGVRAPSVIKINPTADPVLVVNFSGTDVATLTNALTRQVVPALQLVDGVGQVSLAGGRPTVTDVVLDPAKMNSRGLTVAQVSDAITRRNVTVPAGSVDTGSLENQVRVADQANSRSALAGLAVGSSDGHVVRLAEVATLRDAPARETSSSRLDGRVTVGLNVTVKSGANVIRTVSGAKQQLEQARGQLPAGVQMVISRDASVFTTAAVSATAEDLILAILLASLVVLIFLQSFRQTLIVLVSIPTSLLATTLMMKIFDFGLDVISLLAMSLLIGILVDDAVVVIENITRHLARGTDPVEAAVRGRMEIGGAAVALTLTDVVVFAPIALAPGMIGDILIEISVTIVVSTLFSLLVSFTLVPMLAARWLRPTGARQRRPHPVGRLLDAGMKKLEGGYVRVLRASLHHRLSVLLAGTCCLFMAVGMVASGKVGTALTPDVDSNILGAEVSLPSGTSIAGSSAALTTMSERLRSSMPDITSVYGTVGLSAGYVTSPSDISLTINLAPKGQRSASLETLRLRVDDHLAQLPGVQASVFIPSPMGDGGGSADSLPVYLSGPDQHRLQELSRQVADSLAARPELSNVSSQASQRTPSWDITLDEAAAGRLGISAHDVAATVMAVTSGSEQSTLRTVSGQDQKVIVRLATDAGGLDLDELRALPVALRPVAGSGAGLSDSEGVAGGVGSTTDGGPRPDVVTLAQVASVKLTTSPQTIEDASQQPRIKVAAFPASGVTSDRAQNAIDTAMAGVTLPSGYSYSIGGAATAQNDAFAPLILAVALAPLLVYMLLAALYESLVLPFAVLLALPLALVGALAALRLGDSTLNTFSMIGMVMLTGLVSKNGILLIDRAEQRRRLGDTAVEALAEAGRTRLRPILMTTLTLVVAMMPIAFMDTPGSEIRSPVALVMIGGMSSSTLLTLLIVPTLYTLLDGMRERLPKAARGLLRGRVPGRMRGWLHGSDPDAGQEPDSPPPSGPDTAPNGLVLAPTSSQKAPD